jgi:hypothetical protein
MGKPATINVRYHDEVKDMARRLWRAHVGRKATKKIKRKCDGE